MGLFLSGGVIGFFSFAHALANPMQRIVDCRNPANSGQCAGNPNLINGDLRNMGQPGMAARIPGLGILQGLCTSLGVSCAGSYDIKSMQSHIQRLEYIKIMQEDMRPNEAANIARMQELRRLADEASRAAAARMVTTGQSQDFYSGVSVITNLCSRAKNQLACKFRSGCSWNPEGRGRCVEVE